MTLSEMSNREDRGPHTFIETDHRTNSLVSRIPSGLTGAQYHARLLQQAIGDTQGDDPLKEMWAGDYTPKSEGKPRPCTSIPRETVSSADKSETVLKSPWNSRERNPDDDLDALMEVNLLVPRVPSLPFHLGSSNIQDGSGKYLVDADLPLSEGFSNSTGNEQSDASDTEVEFLFPAPRTEADGVDPRPNIVRETFRFKFSKTVSQQYSAALHSSHRQGTGKTRQKWDGIRLPDDSQPASVSQWPDSNRGESQAESLGESTIPHSKHRRVFSPNAPSSINPNVSDGGSGSDGDEIRCGADDVLESLDGR